MHFGFYEAAIFFFIYAFVGWFLEVVYYTLNTAKFVNRGFLNGPWCPVYGVAFTVIIILLTPLKENLAVLFCGSFFLASAIEFVTGFLLEKIFNDKWWDYTDEPFNIKGYICLKFSLMWAIACTTVMRLIHPMINTLVTNIPELLLKITVWSLVGVFACDLIFTVSAIRALRVRLNVAKEISERLKYISDNIGEDISEATLSAMEIAEETKEKREALKLKRKQSQQEMREKFNTELEEIRQRYRDYVDKRSFTQSRLGKAFPRLDFERTNDEGKTLKDRIREAVEKYKINR